MYLYSCKRVFCVQERECVYYGGGGSPLHPPGILYDVSAPGPDAREPMERSRPGVGTRWVLDLVW